MTAAVSGGSRDEDAFLYQPAYNRCEAAVLADFCNADDQRRLRHMSSGAPIHVQPQRNIFAGFRAWPKNLTRFSLSEIQLAAIWRRPIHQTEDDPFRPDGFIIYFSTLLASIDDVASAFVVPKEPVKNGF